jgi:hypothetical protein
MHGKTMKITIGTFVKQSVVVGNKVKAFLFARHEGVLD